MRITTNAILRNYSSNLSKSVTNLNEATTRVLTNRKFNSVAEDPTSAARASSLYRSLNKNNDYLNLINDVQSQQDEQESALTQITTMAQTITKEYGLEAVNGTNSDLESRQSYATSIRSLQSAMVSNLNASYEDSFVFAGTDGMNVPFVLSEDGSTLTYRGIDVDAAQGTADYDQLSEYAQEKQYVDLGMGLTIDDTGDIVSSSAFNKSLPGIASAGYGKDSDGVSNNIVLLTGQLADVLEAETFDQDKYETLLNKLDSARTSMINDVSKLGVQSNFLETTKNRLTDQQVTLNTQIQQVEGMDLTEMAGALTDMSWSQYAYNSALKVGTSILSSSFIDFMN